MTDNPVDMSTFHEMTDGDKEFEAKIFSIFEDTVKHCIATIGDNDAVKQKRASHELKGAALNLGANKLAELCKIVELSENIDTNMVENIKIESALVLEFLREVYS